MLLTFNFESDLTSETDFRMMIYSRAKSRSIAKRRFFIWLLVMVTAQYCLISCASKRDILKSRYWSVEVAEQKVNYSVVTTSKLNGNQSLGNHEFSGYRNIARSGIFELGMIEIITEGSELEKNPLTCMSEFSESKFTAKMELLESWLQPLPNGQNVRFTILLIPADTKYKSKEKVEFEKTLPVKLAIHGPTGKTKCDDWWASSLSHLVHEFVHAYLEVTDFKSPNLTSEEVIAYSISSCISLVSQQPDRIFPKWGSDPDNDNFEREYLNFVSGKNLKPAWFAKVPTFMGGGMADLHFYHIYDNSFPAKPSTEQNNAVSRYCEYVITQPHDYMESSYFDKT